MADEWLLNRTDVAVKIVDMLDGKYNFYRVNQVKRAVRVFGGSSSSSSTS